MKYKLMHKNIPVMEFWLDDVTCSIIKIGNIYHPEHLPVGIPVVKGTVNTEKGSLPPAGGRPSFFYFLFRSSCCLISHSFWDRST